MPSNTAIDRLARVLDIVPLLTEKAMSTRELAMKVNTDEETISRDLEIAFLCGLPGYTPDLLIDVDLEGEKISVRNPQVLDAPRRLGAEEVSLLLFGLELLQNLMAISTTILQTLESLRSKISKSHNLPLSHGLGTEIDSRLRSNLQKIEQALIEEKDLKFAYVDTLGVRSIRNAAPQRIFWRSNRITLESFDHGKKDLRNFFISAMTEVQVVPRTPVEISINDKQGGDWLSSKIEFSSIPNWWLRRNSPFIDEVKTEESKVNVTLRYWSRDWLIRTVVPIADKFIQIIDDQVEDDAFRSALLRHISGK